MKIAGKVFVGYGIIAAVAVAIGLIGHRAAETTRLHHYALVEKHLPILNALQDLRFRASQFFEETATQRLSRTEPHASRDVAGTPAPTLSAQDYVRAAFVEYERLVRAYFPQEHDFAGQVGRAVDRTLSSTVDATKLSARAEQDPSRPERLTEFQNARRELLDIIHDATVRESQEIEELRELVAQTFARQLQLTVLMGAGTFVVALAIGIFVSRRIARPIRALQKAAASLGAGELTARANIATKDETGMLAAAFNQMADSLSRTITASNYFESILLSLADGLIVVDSHLTIVKVNDTTQEMLGFHRDELIGQSLDRILPTASLDNLSSMTTSGALRHGFASTANRKEGPPLPILVAGASLQEPASEGMVFAIKDITELRRFEDQLVAKNAELQKEIGERKRTEQALLRSRDTLQDLVIELSEARDMAMEANRAKSAFLATMSHELRTPLNAIIGYAEMLQEETASLKDKAIAGDLDRIRGAGKHLLQLINDVLDLSKIEADRFELCYEMVTLPTFLDELKDTVRPLADKNGTRLVLSIAPDLGDIEADPVRLRQILFNLLNNACKFTAHGTVTLRVTTLRVGTTPSYAFAVKDTGIGISPEDQLKLFQRFSQVDDSATRKFEGTGLGLAIVRRLCELMGGRVTVESVVGAGSTFTAILPMRRPHSSVDGTADDSLASAVL